MGCSAEEASSTSDLINQISPMLAPKIAEVKYTLIGLEDVCIGQTSSDWLLRDKQVSGLRKYGPDLPRIPSLNYSVQRQKDSQQNICPCRLQVVGISGGISRKDIAREFAKETIG